MSLGEEARRNFNSGYNCAESVLLVVSKQSGLPGEVIIPRIATGFGGGIARNGNICGALAGGVAVISLALGRDMSTESRDPCYRAVDQFYNEFLESFGAYRCRELTGVDLRTPEGRQAYESRIHNQRCNPIVAWAAERAFRIIRDTRRTGAQ